MPPDRRCLDEPEQCGVGPFSIVWGLAIAIATKMLYNYRERSDGFLFVLGTVLGGAYEYLCSVFTELVFGVVFWDYSDIPFNLGGRINLLYCFFWGIAAVIWLKKCYPRLSNLIERLPMKVGKGLTWCLVLFMVCNIIPLCPGSGPPICTYRREVCCQLCRALAGQALQR